MSFSNRGIHDRHLDGGVVGALHNGLRLFVGFVQALCKLRLRLTGFLVTLHRPMQLAPIDVEVAAGGREVGVSSRRAAASVALYAQTMAAGAMTGVDVLCLLVFVGLALFFWALAQEQVRKPPGNRSHCRSRFPGVHFLPQRGSTFRCLSDGKAI